MSLRIIAGRFRGRILKAPKGLVTRPTQGVLREAVFNICQDVIQGAVFLDLFAGSGAIGLEAISRGASHATFVENDRRAIVSIRANIASLQIASQTTLLCCDAISAVRQLSSPFNIIYIDPPYETPVALLVEALMERCLLSSHGRLFIEERSRSCSPLLRFSSLEWIDTRRFGEALLHQYTQRLTFSP